MDSTRRNIIFTILHQLLSTLYRYEGFVREVFERFVETIITCSRFLNTSKVSLYSIRTFCRNIFLRVCYVTRVARNSFKASVPLMSFKILTISESTISLIIGVDTSTARGNSKDSFASLSRPFSMPPFEDWYNPLLFHCRIMLRKRMIFYFANLVQIK